MGGYTCLLKNERPDVESNHIFPLHKYILANILMKGDVLPVDYRVVIHLIIAVVDYLNYRLF